MKRVLCYFFMLLLFISCASKTLDVPLTASPEERQLIETANETYTFEAYLNLAKYYAHQKNHSQAVKAYNLALSLDTLQYETRFEFAEYAYTHEFEKDALFQFQKLLRSGSSETFLPKITPYFIKFKTSTLISDTSNNAFPSFSKDSKTVYFQSDRNQNWDILGYSIPTDSTFFLVETDANEEHPTLSPDGKLLSYTSDQFDKRIIDPSQKWREIMLYNIDLEKTNRLTVNYCDDFYPRFHQNSNEITFISERSDIRNVAYGERHTQSYIMDPDGSFQVPLTKNEGTVNSGVLSSDKKWVYYSSKLSDRYHIYRKNQKTKAVDTLIETENDLVSVDISPNGKFLVYSTINGSTSHLYLYDTEFGQIEQLTQSNLKEDKAIFSNDGNYLVFHRLNKNKNYEIALLFLTKREMNPTLENVLARLNERLNQLGSTN